MDTILKSAKLDKNKFDKFEKIHSYNERKHKIRESTLLNRIRNTQKKCTVGIQYCTIHNVRAQQT